MSAAALQVLPYDDSENRSELLPARLARLQEGNKHPAFQLLELKGEVFPKAERELPRPRLATDVPPPLGGHRNATPLPSHERSYSPWLIGTFAIGMIVSAIGVFLLIILAFTNKPGIGIISASCLVVGTTAVALSLLRGEDLEGAAG